MSNRKPGLSYTFKENVTLFNFAIKAIKSGVPSNCTFLSLVKKSSGEIMIKSVVKDVNSLKKDTFLYTIPQDFSLTTSDLERIKELITKKCIEYGA